MSEPDPAEYIPIVKMIAEAFGNDYEIVLHNLEIPQRSVVYTIHNYITVRNINQAILSPRTLSTLNWNRKCNHGTRRTKAARFLSNRQRP